MENKKYELFINLLNFSKGKYSTEKVFKDFISLFAISLSNKVVFNKKNSDKYEEIYQSYRKKNNLIFMLYQQN